VSESATQSDRFPSPRDRLGPVASGQLLRGRSRAPQPTPGNGSCQATPTVA
jgi:hypothetical protein